MFNASRAKKPWKSYQMGTFRTFFIQTFWFLSVCASTCWYQGGIAIISLWRCTAFRLPLPSSLIGSPPCLQLIWRIRNSGIESYWQKLGTLQYGLLHLGHTHGSVYTCPSSDLRGNHSCPHAHTRLLFPSLHGILSIEPACFFLVEPGTFPSNSLTYISNIRHIRHIRYKGLASLDGIQQFHSASATSIKAEATGRRQKNN